MNELDKFKLDLQRSIYGHTEPGHCEKCGNNLFNGDTE